MAKKKNTATNEAENSQAKIGELEKELQDNKAEYESKALEYEGKLTELNDKYLRCYAEFDNYKKRSIKEKEESYQQGYAKAVLEILPIIDNMERAEAMEGGVSDGVKMIISAMRQALEKMGVTEIETKTFDPNYHNAVMHIDDEAYGENEIVEVFQKGYKYKDKVIRYAMVRVAN